jgi:hypothetical protein
MGHSNTTRSGSRNSRGSSGPALRESREHRLGARFANRSCSNPRAHPSSTAGQPVRLPAETGHDLGPREYRTTGGQAPLPESKTLVHGDYFSANILAVPGGLRIIHWETFGWGDPMWDLASLVGADRNIPKNEIRATIAEYEKEAPVNREHLLWRQLLYSNNRHLVLHRVQLWLLISDACKDSLSRQSRYSSHSSSDCGGFSEYL